VKRDPSFPRLHGRPPQGWLNDPHGCVRVDGRYHVFFQHNPDEPRHAAIKWGHMSSADLAHWEPEPIALVNRPGELDAAGCWTGSVVDDGGTPTAVYSAVANGDERSVVLVARGDRALRTWEQGRAPAFGAPADPAVTHARDPFVFAFEGRRYALQGAGSYVRGGAARVLVYACDDLDAWTELGPLVSAQDDPAAAELAPADVWECPNLFPLGDRWVLLVSLWYREGGGAHDVRYLVGDLEATAAGPRFRAERGGRLDRGPCFYAPQVLRDGDRTLVWGWARERRSAAEIAAAGWAGTLTFCRELRLLDGVVASVPVPELDVLRARPLAVDWPFRAHAFDLDVAGPARRASLWLDDVAVAEFAAPARVLVDGSIVEVFDGPAPFTTRAYPTAASRWRLRLERPGRVEAWTLGRR